MVHTYHLSPGGRGRSTRSSRLTSATEVPAVDAQQCKEMATRPRPHVLKCFCAQTGALKQQIIMPKPLYLGPPGFHPDSSSMPSAVTTVVSSPPMGISAVTPGTLDDSEIKGKSLQGGRVVQSRYLQYEKKIKKTPAARTLKAGRKPPDGRKPRAPRSKEDSSRSAKEDLQSTMLEGHSIAPPDLDLSCVNEKSMVKKTLHSDRMMPEEALDMEAAMDMMESQTLLLSLLTVTMEEHVAHLEAKAEKELEIMCREREQLQAHMLELRHRLLLSQKGQELNATLDAQIEMLSPFEAVMKRFREQYKTMATALDTTRHELPMQEIYLQGSGEELLDALQPALRTTYQLLRELGVDTADTSTQALCLLSELKDTIASKDLELHRIVSQVLELSAEASKEVTLMNQEAWEEAQGAEACSQWYFSPPTPGVFRDR